VYNQPVKTSRQKILDYFHLRKIATVDDLSRVLHFTEANIRHHINQLMAEGVVVKVGKRPARGRGRPHSLFGLKVQMTSHNLDNLASAALEIIFSEKVSPVGKEMQTRKLASTMAKKGHITGTNPSKKLLQVVNLLNEMNYQARWEAHDEGPRVIFNHCPYSSIIREHPELCQMDAHLLEELLGASASLKACLEPGPTGLPHCIFSLNKADLNKR
jgi:predicted ArsR family transcriptional regulator